MATDGPTPPDCAADIYDHGTLMFQTASIGGSNAIERWVQKVAATSEQPVDWHFAGGCVMVLALGDLDRVKAAIRAHMPEHDAMFRARHADSNAKPYRPAWWSNESVMEQDTAPRVTTDVSGNHVLVDPEAVSVIETIRRLS